MKIVKQTADFTIYQKGSGRYAVKGAGGRWMNGEDKIRVLTDEGFVTLNAPKAATPDAEDAAAGAGEEASPAEA